MPLIPRKFFKSYLLSKSHHDTYFHIILGALFSIYLLRLFSTAIMILSHLYNILSHLIITSLIVEHKVVSAVKKNFEAQV